MHAERVRGQGLILRTTRRIEGLAQLRPRGTASAWAQAKGESRSTSFKNCPSAIDQSKAKANERSSSSSSSSRPGLGGPVFFFSLKKRQRAATFPTVVLFFFFFLEHDRRRGQAVVISSDILSMAEHNQALQLLTSRLRLRLDRDVCIMPHCISSR